MRADRKRFESEIEDVEQIEDVEWTLGTLALYGVPSKNVIKYVWELKDTIPGSPQDSE